MQSLREEALNKLEVFMLNPGRFTILVTGSRGTGKLHGIDHLFQHVTSTDESELEEKTIKTISHCEARHWPSDSKGMDALLKKNHFGVIVLKDVDQLSFEQQNMLFDLLSTSNGLFGIKKQHQVRMIFTSSKNIEDLRTENIYLTGKFWDRISQLTVEMPSFKKDPSTIVKDFHAVWNKMEFDSQPEYKALAGIPKNAKLEAFLENHSGSFEGNFRDLDKIAILYFNYRILLYKDKRKISEPVESEIVQNVKEDFLGKLQLHTNPVDELSIFRFREEHHSVLLQNFKIALRKWAVRKFGSVAKAEEKLHYKKGTMKNFVEKRPNGRHKE